MLWHFRVSNNSGETTDCGIMVQPNSFVNFEYDSSGVFAWFDVKNCSNGVQHTPHAIIIYLCLMMPILIKPF